jgi:hypothetical protein
MEKNTLTTLCVLFYFLLTTFFLDALFVSGCRFLRRTRLLCFVPPAKLPIAEGVIGTWVTSRRHVVLSRVVIGSKTAGR